MKSFKKSTVDGKAVLTQTETIKTVVTVGDITNEIETLERQLFGMAERKIELEAELVILRKQIEDIKKL